jgi:uncharacterized protein (TIGR02217 family)
MFIEERLLECATFGSAMAPTWRTRRIPLKSGVTRRNPLRSRPLYRLTMLYRNLTIEKHAEVINAFNACLGGVHSFRVKDWSDFKANNELLPVLGTGAPQSVQLIKTYAFGATDIARNIRKPVDGTVIVTANGVPVSAVVSAVGVATFTAANGAILRWSGQFDVPMMFEVDELPFTGDEKSGDGGDDALLLTGDVPLVEDIDV